MTRTARQKAHRRGQWAEMFCCAILICRGYKILARRFRCPVGEIDIIAQRGATVAIVEVKARDTFEAGLHAVLPAQRRRLARATEWFIATRPQFTTFTVRFDIMLFTPRRWPYHIVNAWQIDF